MYIPTGVFILPLYLVKQLGMNVANIRYIKICKFVSHPMRKLINSLFPSKSPKCFLILCLTLCKDQYYPYFSKTKTYNLCKLILFQSRNLIFGMFPPTNVQLCQPRSPPTSCRNCLYKANTARIKD